MVDKRLQLERIAIAIAELRRRRRDNPINYIDWLPGQHKFLNDASKRKLFRAGNQAHGKTLAGLSAIHFRCTGQHPFLKVPDPPIEAWVICASWSQSQAIQQKFWDLVGKTGALVDGIEFDAKNGFGAKNPIVRYRNGSVVRFKTTQQGSINLSGATIDLALFDEPPASQRVYSEIQKRLIRRSGTLLLTLTPIGAPCDWLKKQVAAGNLSETWAKLEAKNLIPVGRLEPLKLLDGTPMDQAWIDGVIAETLDHEVGVVCHGEWEIRTSARVFSAFSTSEHVTEHMPRGECTISIGIDYGDGANFSQSAILVAVDDSGGFARVHVLDMLTSEASTTIDQDAAAILAMLHRNGMSWGSIDQCYGDRVWSGKRSNLAKKSNRSMQAAIGQLLQIPEHQMTPKLQTVKRGQGHGRGSVAHGCRWLHAAMVRPDHFTIHPRCENLIASLNKWNFGNDENKHAIDALRYAVDNWIFAKRSAVVSPVILG